VNRFRALACVLLAIAPALHAQENAIVRQAVAAYDDLDRAGAIKLATRALQERLSSADRARAYEVLGFSYAALDSVQQATSAFKRLLQLDADRDLDPGRISPKITGAFALALGQVLVVRKVTIDTAAFIAGTSAVPIEFTVTHPARVRALVRGAGGDVLVDSAVSPGPTSIRWNGLMADGKAAVSGSYRLVIEASAGSDLYSRAIAFRVTAAPVDTLPHLTSLPGYDLLPEMVAPPRSWKPFGIAALVTAGVAGATLALNDSKLGSGSQTPLLVVSGSALLVGGLAVAQKPAPVPNTANIRYNNLVKEQLAKQNAEITKENARRRTEVRIKVAEIPAVPGGS
jgi:hypothetical protein